MLGLRFWEEMGGFITSTEMIRGEGLGNKSTKNCLALEKLWFLVQFSKQRI